jgi:hypothetical protein
VSAALAGVAAALAGVAAALEGAAAAGVEAAEPLTLVMEGELTRLPPPLAGPLVRLKRETNEWRFLRAFICSSVNSMYDSDIVRVPRCASCATSKKSLGIKKKY